MTGKRQRLVGAKHPRAGAEAGLGLEIVQPRIASGDEQEHLARTHRERFSDPPRLNTQRIGGLVDRGGARLDLDDRQIGRALGEVGADGFKAHFITPPAVRSVSPWGRRRRMKLA